MLQSSVRKEPEVRKTPSKRNEAERSIAEPKLTLCHSYNVSPEDLFDLFGKFGPIRFVVLALSLPD
jgi:RNA recognition motif-containing protein